jgi:hypothetical protein
MESTRRPSQADAGELTDAPGGSNETRQGSASSDAPRRDTGEDAIARRAYQRFEERGREHGHDVDDWLEAERDLNKSTD